MRKYAYDVSTLEKAKKIMVSTSVKPKTWEPITSVLYDIHTVRYASLHNRYDDVIIKKYFVELSNSFTHQCFVLNNPNTLHWEDI